MIAPGRQARYIARRGKLARRYGEIVTILTVQKWQILIRFPDGAQAHIAPRFLRQLDNGTGETPDPPCPH